MADVTVVLPVTEDCEADGARVHRRRKASVQPVGVHRLRSERIGSGTPKAAGADSSQRKKPAYMDVRAGRPASPGTDAPDPWERTDGGSLRSPLRPLRGFRSAWTLPSGRSPDEFLWKGRLDAATVHTLQQNQKRPPRRFSGAAEAVQGGLRVVLGRDSPAARNHPQDRKTVVSGQGPAQRLLPLGPTGPGQGLGTRTHADRAGRPRRHAPRHSRPATVREGGRGRGMSEKRLPGRNELQRKRPAYTHGGSVGLKRKKGRIHRQAGTATVLKR